MAWEVECVMRFEEGPPTEDEIEYLLDCIVVEWTEEEV